MVRSARIPRRFRHIPVVWWLATLALAVLVGLAVTTSVANAEESAARYGSSVTVFVVDHRLEAGHKLNEDDVTEEQWPKAFLPAAEPIDNPVGLLLDVPMEKGEPLTAAKVGPAGVSPTVALLHPGERGIAVPTSATMPTLQIGDPVEVLATFTTEGGNAPTTSVASVSRVIAVSDSAVTVAVTETQAPAVAFANAKGVVTLALSLPRSSGSLDPS